MVLLGVSNMVSDIYECANEVGKKITQIVINVPEQKRERTKDINTRLHELNERPRIVTLEEFVPGTDDEYFVAPTTPKKASLVEFLVEKHGLRFTRLIHPTAYVSPYARIGQGVFVGALSVIGPGAVPHDHVSVSRKVSLGHDTVIHRYARVNPGCNVAGHVDIGEGATIGMGADIIEELIIGREAVVAAGAVVLKDVPEHALVAGVLAVTKKFYDH